MRILPAASATALLLTGMTVTPAFTATDLPTQSAPAAVWHTDSHYLPASTSAVTAAKKGKGYAFLQEQSSNPGEPVRWNPCDTITWSWTSGKDDDVKYMAKSFAAISRATGMTIEKVTSGADITINYKALPPSVLGLGGFRSEGFSKSLAVSGHVDISPLFKRPNVSPKLHLGTFTHELGHVFGLGHVNSRKQLMYPAMGKRFTFGAGDKAGLRQLGVQAGCISKPVAPAVTMSTQMRQVDYSWWDPESGPAPVEFENVAPVSWQTPAGAEVDQVEIYDPQTDKSWIRYAEAQPDGTSRVEFTVKDNTFTCRADLEAYVYMNDPYYGPVEGIAPITCT